MSHIRPARNVAWLSDEPYHARGGKILHEQFFYDTQADSESEPMRTIARIVA
jgi:hypothetical protein